MPSTALQQSYAGIGSRSSPPEVLAEMSRIAERMARAGWCLNSGAADGADSAFEQGCDAARGEKRIFLPWASFNGRSPKEPGVLLVPKEAQVEAERIAATSHPAWKALSIGARKLHTRNVCQVLGADLASPVQAVLCWTPNGSGRGGTGLAIRLARAYGIPVFDLGTPGSDFGPELDALLMAV